MKTLHAVFLAVVISASAAAQTKPFTITSGVASAGIGLGGTFGNGFSSSSETPAFSIQYEQGIKAVDSPAGIISVGGYIGYKSYKYANRYSSNYEYNQKWSYTIIGFRSAFHYLGIESEVWDLYSGLMVSYNAVSYSYEDNDPRNDTRFDSGTYGSYVGVSWFGGARYFFTKQIAAFAELGYGVSYLSIGVAFKIL